jgi:hypothetical protein
VVCHPPSELIQKSLSRTLEEQMGPRRIYHPKGIINIVRSMSTQTMETKRIVLRIHEALVSFCTYWNG